MNRFFTLLKAKFKNIAPPATLADAPYFLSAKSKQKRYRQVRRPMLRIGFPAVLTFAGGQRTRCSRNAASAQTPLTLLPAKLPLLGGYQAHPRQSQKRIQCPSSVQTRNDPLVHPNSQRFLAYKPLNVAEGNQTSGKLKQSKRTASTSMIQKAPLLAVLSALFGYFLLQPAKSYSHQLGAAKRRNAFDFVCIQPNPSGASI